MQQQNEPAIEYMRRIVSSCNYELEGILYDLPSIEAIVEYFELQSQYDTEFQEGIMEAIANGDDPSAYNAFLEKWNLPWTTA